MDLGVKKYHDQDNKILADNYVIISPNSLIGDLKVKRHIYNEMNIELHLQVRQQIQHQDECNEFRVVHKPWNLLHFITAVKWITVDMILLVE